MQGEWFTVFGGAAQRLHFRPPTTAEWTKHEAAYQAAAGTYRSGVDGVVDTDVEGIIRAHVTHALPLVTGIEVEDDADLPVEGDWREWVKGQGVYQPVLRALAQLVFLFAARKSRPGSRPDGGAAGVPEDTAPGA